MDMQYYSSKIINKQQLIVNYNMLKRVSNKDICAVVKANAYGHGMNQICKILQDKCNFFAVHNLSEAIELRKINNNATILILGYCNNYYLAQKHNISVSIDAFDQIKKIICLDKSIKVHLKINTGMNRFGLKSFKEFLKILKYINAKKNIIIEGIYTHCFDTKDTNITNKQLLKFKKYVMFIKKHYPFCIVHIGGSGMILYKNPEFIDFIRVGIGLYGYLNNLTKPIMQIKSKIIKINTVRKNDFIGYDSYFKAKHKMKIGVVPFGYADGMIRQFQNKMEVYLNNESVKIVGKICMDVFMIDITDKKASLNDEIIIFNNADYWANNSGLSQYEILTGLNKSRCNTFIKHWWIIIILIFKNKDNKNHEYINKRIYINKWKQLKFIKSRLKS